MPACRRTCSRAVRSAVRGVNRFRPVSWATRCDSESMGGDPMNTFVRCGSLFTGREDDARSGEVLVYDEEGRILYVGAEAAAPRSVKGDRLIDHSGSFVMPGLIDV